MQTVDLTRIKQYPKVVKFIRNHSDLEVRFYEYEQNKLYKKRTLQYQVLYKIPLGKVDKFAQAMIEEKYQFGKTRRKKI